MLSARPNPVAQRFRRRFPGWMAPGDGTATIIGSFLVLSVLTAFWFIATRMSPDTWVPILIIVGALVVSIPICVWLSSNPRDLKLRKLLIAGLIFKLGFTFARYYVVEVSYDGVADAGQYHNAALTFLQNLRQGHWSLEGANLDSFGDQTKFVGYLTGMLYTVVGPTYMGGFLAFSWVCWFGLVLFFQAFRITYPDARPYLAAVLLFFLPSMLFWPSSMGKDAPMVFALGLLTYGIARLVKGEKRLLGVAAVLGGTYLIMSIRPHVLLVALVGLAASMVARNASGTKTTSAVVSRVVILVLLVPLLIVGVGRMDEVFGDGGSVNVSQTLSKTSEQTSIGGSSFETQPVSNPLDFPVAIISVVYRPFIFEASGSALISAAEGSLLLFLTVISASWLWRMFPAMYRNQFTAFCGAYVLAFVFAFSNIGNAGILARQRVQMFPFVMLLVLAAREHYRVHVELAAPENPAPEPSTASPSGELAPV